MGENMKHDFAAGTEGRRHGLRGITGGAEPGAARKRRGQSEAPYARSWNGTPVPGTRVVGYASCVGAGHAGTVELKDQATAITLECKRRGLVLTEVVAEREIGSRRALGRPALTYALDRLRSGDAQGLVVADLSRITHSATELGTIIEWLTSLNVRLVAAAHGLDTESEDGRFAADMLVEVLRWERDRLSERTRNGLRAARMNGKSSGRRAVTDDPGLSERIAQMRAQGMTLQAIADRLNEEGVPTVRGGTKWRHSSVQAAAGYRRRQRPLSAALPVPIPPVGQPSS
jgi:DNA invertase Pin-like site-specific DNA recombinase